MRGGRLYVGIMRYEMSEVHIVRFKVKLMRLYGGVVKVVRDYTSDNELQHYEE